MTIDVPVIMRNSLIRIACLTAALGGTLQRAQVPVSPPAPSVAQAQTPKDALGRNTPRGTVLVFLAAGRKGNMAVASQFLNTPLKGPAADALARELFTVLDRRLPP